MKKFIQRVFSCSGRASRTQFLFGSFILTLALLVLLPFLWPQCFLPIPYINPLITLWRALPLIGMGLLTLLSIGVDSKTLSNCNAFLEFLRVAFFVCSLSALIIGAAINSTTLLIRRLQDINVSGWWILALVIYSLGVNYEIGTGNWVTLMSEVGFLIMLISVPGTKGDNRFGKEPGESKSPL